MKRFLVLAMAAFTLVAVSCKKESNNYTCTTCKSTPDALAAHDNSSKGIYKGVVIGSSGTISFNIMNSGTTITATLVLNGVTANLTSQVSWNAGVAYVGAFSGTYNGQPITLTFSVNQDGSNPTVTTASIPGHPNAIFTIIKETSTSLIEAFQGTYTKPSSSGTESGVFNILVARPLNKFRALTRKNGSSSPSTPFEGTVNNGNLSYTFSSGGNPGTLSGKITGDVLSGTLVDMYGTGTFNGQRTL